VTGLPDVKVGDEVVLLGRQGNERIGADELAAKAQTISYELLCDLGNRNRRVYVNGEE
jgi:alanine racemase